MLRKIIVAGVMLSTVLSLSVVAAPSAKAAASAGDLIKMNGMSSVYYLGANGKRYVFPNEATYFSWYKDFSGVVTVPQSEIETYPLAANVVIRPGTKLVKSPSISTVYAVEPSGVLRSIVSEANAIALWGADWNKKVVDVIDAFFTNYTVGTPLTVGKYPAGQLIKTSGSPDVYVIAADGSARKFGSEAGFVSNNYSFDYVQTVASTFTMPASGSAINGREDSLADVSQGGGAGSGVIAGTGITVALASDTPSSATIPQTAPSDFLKFNVTASNDGAATINSIKFTASGLGTHTAIDGVTVYVNGARVGSAKDVDSNSEANMNFSSGIVIPAGQTKSIVVRANIASGDTNNHALGIARAADIVATGATISGSFPITGNMMTGSSVTVGQLTVGTGNSLSNPKIGDKAAMLASVKLTNGNTEDISISSITLKRSAGTAADDDFENIGLFVSGVKVASSNGIKDKFVTFTFDTPYLLEKNKEKKFDVKGDVVDGATKTVTISLDSTSDVVAMGRTYGTYAKVTGSYAGSSLTVQSGAIALEKQNAANDKVRKDTTNVELGTIKVTPTTGKNVELKSLKITITTSTSTTSNLENVEIMDKATGNVYDLTLNSGKYENTAMDLTLTSGATKEFVVRTDINAAADTGVTYTVSMSAADWSIEDLDSNPITDITPSSLSLSAVTIQAPALTISTNALSSALNAVVGTSNVQVLSFNLKANSTDALKVTELSVADVSSSDINSRVISQVRLYKNGEAVPMESKSGSEISSQAVTFDALSINVPKGEEVKYYVTVDFVNDSAESGTTTQWAITGYAAEDATEGESVYDVSADSNTDGVIADTVLRSARVVTIVGSGSLLVEMDNTNSDTLKDRYEIAGNTTNLLAALKVRGANENVNIEDLRIKVLDSSDASSTNANSIFSKLQIVDSDKTTVLKEISNVSAETLVEDINVVIPSTGSKTLYIKGVLNLIGKDQVGVDDQGVKFRVDSVIAKGIDSNQALIGARASSSASTCASSYVCYVTDGAATQLGTDSSMETGVLASKISSVDLVSTGGGCSISSSLSAGWNTVAVIKVTTDNTSNTLTTGDDVKTVLDTITVNHASTSVAVSQYTIERCGGTGGTISASAASSSAAVFALSTWSTDDEIAKSGTAYFAVKYYVSSVSSTAGASSIQVDLNRLDYASAKANFKWYDSTDASAKYPLRLSTNKINGTKITN